MNTILKQNDTIKISRSTCNIKISFSWTGVPGGFGSGKLKNLSLRRFAGGVKSMGLALVSKGTGCGYNDPNQLYEKLKAMQEVKGARQLECSLPQKATKLKVQMM